MYSLDETRPAGPDLDGDGVVDGDNCPTIGNADQVDTDGDEVGDACDPCPLEGATQLYEDVDLDGVDDGCDVCTRGPGTHDEDGDGIVDACDNCPAVNAPQTNSDGDDLGDACDPDGAAQQRVVFEGFASIPEGWYASRDDWTVTNDAVGPAVTPTVGAGENEGLWNRNFDVSSASWVFESAIDVPPIPSMPFYVVGIGLRPRSQPTIAYCQLAWDGTRWGLSTIGGSAQVTVVAPAGETTARVVLRLRALTATSARCSYGSTTLTSSTFMMYALTPTLFTNRNAAAFRYLDLAN